MLKFNVEIAGEVISLFVNYNSTFDFFKNYLTDKNFKYHVDITQEDIKNEHVRSDIQREREGLPFYRYSDEYIETLAIYRKLVDILVLEDIILFHGSCVAVDDKAYLFTAPSGTGKSTHTRLWSEYFGENLTFVNDDKPLLRVEEDKVYVYGTPWMGKHNIGNNVKFQLSSICKIVQGKNNIIVRKSFNEFYNIILEQSQKPSNGQLVLNYLKIIDKISNKLRYYELSCDISHDAVEVSYNGMRGEN